MRLCLHCNLKLLNFNAFPVFLIRGAPYVNFIQNDDRLVL